MLQPLLATVVLFVEPLQATHWYVVQPVLATVVWFVEPLQAAHWYVVQPMLATVLAKPLCCIDVESLTLASFWNP